MPDVDVESAERVIAAREWPVTVALARPVEFAGETISSLQFRRGRVGDLKGLSLDGIPPAEQLMLLASRMCGKPLKVIELLEDGDGSEVLEIAIGFFARCLGAGRKV